MADIFPSVTEEAALAALRAVIQSVVGCEVIRAQQNRVPMPKGDFVAMTVVGLTPLSTNVDTYTSSTKAIKRPARLSVQIDCYGADSNQRSAAIAAILRDEFATEQFIAAGVDMQTLYAGDATQTPIVDGQEQYQERWTFTAELQVNPVLTVTQETANALSVGLVNVDSKYPPE